MTSTGRRTGCQRRVTRSGEWLACSALGLIGLRRITVVSRIPGNGRFREVTEGHEGRAVRVQAAPREAARTLEDMAPTRFGTVSPLPRDGSTRRLPCATRKSAFLREQLRNSRCRSGRVVGCRFVFAGEKRTHSDRTRLTLRSRPTFVSLKPQVAGRRLRHCFTSSNGARRGGLDTTAQPQQ